jgi:abhydrolase domain-containing protein 17
MTRALFRLGLYLLGLYLLLWIASPFLADLLTYPAPPPSYGPLKEKHRFPAADGTLLTSLWLPPPPGGLTFLFFHGNGEDLGSIQDFLRELHACGFGIMAIDYRGYGETPGKPTERLLLADGLVAYDTLIHQQKIMSSSIIPFGRSLGGGIAAYVAAERAVGGLILESTYISTFKVMFPFLWFPNDQYTTRKRLPQIQCPVLIIHGTEDEVIPFWHGEKLYALAREPKRALWVEGGHHADLFYAAGPRYRETLQDFSRLINAPPSP